MQDPMAEGSMMDSRKPRFFKVLLPGFFTQLRLPQAFVNKYILLAEDEKSRSVTLSGPDGNTWNVILHKSQQDTYFCGAKWQACVQALDLKVGYFLHFSYDGNNLFSFEVFDLSTCEKIYHQIPLSTSRHTSKKLKTCKDGGNFKTDAKKTETCKDCLYFKTDAKKSETCKDGHNFEIVSKNLTHIISYCQDCKCTRLESCISRTNLLTKIMELPLQFWKLAEISKEQDMLILVDPLGRSWFVKLCLNREVPRKGSARTRIFMRKGFDNLILNNQLELGDTCVFELESGEKNKIQVKIRKAGMGSLGSNLAESLG